MVPQADRDKRVPDRDVDHKIAIVGFDPKYSRYFRELNEAWITQHFEMEEADFRVLENPDLILQQGGDILFALCDQVVVGTCALIKLNDPKYDFELAKMGVAEDFQGMGIGYRLGLAIIEKAKDLGATNLFLESNRVLAPAINLYRKLGFNEVSDRPSPYRRADIQMVLEISS